MKIKDVQMNLSAVSKSQYPADGRPQIALVGRSNVGKSSMINSLINRKNFARTSQTPGKTRTINFYSINKEFYLVDLPGYGYAKLSKNEKISWGKVMEEYFTNANNLEHVFLLLDIRHKPKEDDILMYDFIKYYNIPISIIATKSDKLSRNEQIKSIKEIKNILDINEKDIYLLSSLKKTGVENIWSHIENIFSDAGYTISYE